MDSPLSILTPQAPRPDHLSARGPAAGQADAADGPGGFARALTAAAATGSALGGGAVFCGVENATAAAIAADAPAAAIPDAVLPVATLLLRRMLADARVMPERGVEAARPDVCGHAAVAGNAGDTDLAVSDVVEEKAAAGKSPRSEGADASGGLALAGTNTALMQWMLQIAPQPPAPVVMQPPQPPQPQPAEAARVGLGRQDGAALLQMALPAGQLGRSEPAGRATDTRASALGARTADRGVSATEFPGIATRPASARSADSPDAEAARAAVTAGVPVDVARPAPAASVDAARVVDPLQPQPKALTSTAATSSAADAQALLLAAATPTAAVTFTGSPVVVPAQTWIQTPVTQPGFSDEVVVELVRRVGQAEQGTQALTMHLNPVELGPVSVSIELNGSAARIEFGASEALTRQHLEAALPGLTEALRDEGVSLTHGGVHEASKESLAASAAGGQASGGTGSDARQRGEALFDGRSGYGDRSPRRETDVFSIDGRAVANGRAPVSRGPSPGRAGRLDLFA